MITIDLDDLEITTDSSHVATEYEVYEKTTNKLICSKENCTGIEKRVMVFYDAININLEYYVTIRVLLDTGWSDKTSHPLTVVSDESLITFKKRPVEIERIERVTTNCSDINNHDTSDFTISIPDFKSDRKADHICTTWVITDVDNRVKMLRHKDEENLTSLRVTRDMVRLKENQVYRIKAMVYSSSGDTSEMTSLTIKTKGIKT